MSRPALEAPAAPRALVIDDEVSVRRILCRVLERSGWEVEEASDAHEASRLLAPSRARRYNMVLCDLNLPGGSGLELRRRTMTHTPGIAERFVLMTGETLANGRLLASDDGVVLLGKPFTLDELMAVQERMAGEVRR